MFWQIAVLLVGLYGIGRRWDVVDRFGMDCFRVVHHSGQSYRIMTSIFVHKGLEDLFISVCYLLLILPEIASNLSLGLLRFCIVLLELTLLKGWIESMILKWNERFGWGQPFEKGSTCGLYPIGLSFETIHLLQTGAFDFSNLIQLGLCLVLGTERRSLFAAIVAGLAYQQWRSIFVLGWMDLDEFYGCIELLIVGILILL